jgi:hypothetical protein
MSFRLNRRILVSGDVAIYQRNGICTQVNREMLVIAGDYELTVVEPYQTGSNSLSDQPSDSYAHPRLTD